MAAAENGLPVAAYSLLATGSATLAVTEGGIADLASAALDGNDVTVPRLLAASVREHVPACVESVAGCSLTATGITLYVKCRYLVSLYVTVRGNVTRGNGGSLLFDVSSAHVGLLPVPQRFLKSALGPGQVVIVDPQASGVAVVSLSTGEGSLAVDLQRTSEGS
jgi:hypothetical protein